MKPKTKAEKEITRLSDSLRWLSQAQYDWAIKNTVHHFAWRSDTGKPLYCTHCGKRIPKEHAVLNENKGITCPFCKKKLDLRESRRGVIDYTYFVVLTTHKSWQVNRYYEVRTEWKARKGASHYIHEVVRKWYKPKQKEITQGVGINQMSYYSHTPYSIWSLMSIKNGEWRSGSWHSEWMPVHVYPHWRVLPVYRKCGFNGKVFDNDVQQTFAVILANPYLERLFKEGKHQEIHDIPPDVRKYIATDMYSSIRIAMRHKYDIKAVGWQNYIDYLLMLKKLKKDLRSPHWICPQDWDAMHDRVLRMMQKHNEKERQKQREKWQIEEARRQAEREAEELRRAEEDKKVRAAYPTLKGFFFGIHIQGKDLSIEPLKSVEEFAEEGVAMHHCVYSMGYYKKPLSLILSARDGKGERLETIEVNLRDFKVNQCYGNHNQPTDRHEEILNAVNSNMWQIRDVCQREDWKQSIRQQGIAVNF